MVASNLVLIPGGGGVGRAVFEQLRAGDVPVRFMVRNDRFCVSPPIKSKTTSSFSRRTFSNCASR